MLPESGQGLCAFPINQMIRDHFLEGQEDLKSREAKDRLLDVQRPHKKPSINAWENLR